jgi:hypothetical protein
LTIPIRRAGGITFRRNSLRGRIPFIAHFPTTTKPPLATGPKRRGSFRGLTKRIKGRASPFVRTVGLAIRKGNKVAYAQWEDAGPFRTDHWQYVFGNERPKPNLNKGAGLDVSPAVRDYLGLSETDVTDWQFVDFKDVPRGPWSKLGENNTFVIANRNAGTQLARAKSSDGPEATSAPQ